MNISSIGSIALLRHNAKVLALSKVLTLTGYNQNFFAFHPILMKLGSCFSGCSQISTTLVDPKKQIIHKKDLWISYFFYNVHCSKTEKSAILGGHTGYLKGCNQCFLIIFRIKHISAE